MRVERGRSRTDPDRSEADIERRRPATQHAARLEGRLRDDDELIAARRDRRAGAGYALVNDVAYPRLVAALRRGRRNKRGRLKDTRIGLRAIEPTGARGRDLRPGVDIR